MLANTILLEGIVIGPSFSTAECDNHSEMVFTDCADLSECLVCRECARDAPCTKKTHLFLLAAPNKY